MTDQANGLAVTVERIEAAGRFVLVCEHASNFFPPRWGDLGLDEAARAAHIAWDPGALGLARGLARRLDAPLVRAGVTRLVYDINRPPNAPAAMPARSEIYDIPGNLGLTPAQRYERTEALYLPFHARTCAEISRRLALGIVPVLVTVHSFTPVFNGTPRTVELGLIHDADPRFAESLLAEARARTSLDCRLNEPYSGADGVAHTLARHATPMGLPHVMLELRNDLIATEAAQEAMAETLAPALVAALARFEGGA